MRRSYKLLTSILLSQATNLAHALPIQNETSAASQILNVPSETYDSLNTQTRTVNAHVNNLEIQADNITINIDGTLDTDVLNYNGNLIYAQAPGGNAADYTNIDINVTANGVLNVAGLQGALNGSKNIDLSRTTADSDIVLQAGSQVLNGDIHLSNNAFSSLSIYTSNTVTGKIIFEGGGNLIIGNNNAVNYTTGGDIYSNFGEGIAVDVNTTGTFNVGHRIYEILSLDINSGNTNINIVDGIEPEDNGNLLTIAAGATLTLIESVDQSSPNAAFSFNLNDVKGNLIVADNKTFAATHGATTIDTTGNVNLVGSLDVGTATSGAFTNRGTILMGGGANNSTLSTINASGNFTNNGGTITLNNRATLNTSRVGQTINQNGGIITLNNVAANTPNFLLSGGHFTNRVNSTVNVYTGTMDMLSGHEIINEGNMNIGVSGGANNAAALQTLSHTIRNNPTGTMTISDSAVVNIANNANAFFINTGTLIIEDNGSIVGVGNATNDIILGNATLRTTTANAAINLVAGTNSSLQISGNLQVGLEGAKINLYQGEQFSYSNGSLTFNLDANGNAGKLEINAANAANPNVNLSNMNAALILADPNYFFSEGESFDVIEATGSANLINTNLNVINETPLYRFKTTLSNNILSIVADHKGYEELSSAPFIKGLSDGLLTATLNKDKSITKIVQALDLLSTQDLEEALKQLTPEVNDVTNNAILSGVSNTNRLVFTRMAELKKENKSYSAGENSMESAWFKVFTGSLFQKRRQNVDGYRMHINGFGIGLDSTNNNITLGGAMGYSTAESESRPVPTKKVNLTNYQAVLYFSYENIKDFFFDGAISYVQSKFSRSRVVDFSNINNVYLAKYPGRQYSAEFKIGHNQKIFDFNFSPIVGLQYIKAAQNKYTEKSAAMGSALNVNKSFRTTLKGKIGFKIMNEYKHKDLIFEPSFNTHLHHDFVKNKQILAASFVGGGVGFEVKGIDPASTGFNFGLGAKLKKSSNLELSLSYDLETKSKFFGNYFYGTLKYKF